MKKVLVITLVLALVLGLSTGIGLAKTQIWENVYNNGGYSFVYQKTTVGKWIQDGDICPPREWALVGGWVEESITVDGAMRLDKYVSAFSQGEMLEVKDLEAWGDTLVCKEAQVYVIPEDWFNPCVWPSVTVEMYQTVMTPTLSDEDYKFLRTGSVAGFDKVVKEDIYLDLDEQTNINRYYDKCIPTPPDKPVCPDC